MITPEEKQMVKDAASKLAEHFDSVRIFVTRHGGDSETTASHSFGVGNYYAQYGCVAEWLDRMRAQVWKHEEGHET